MQPIRAVVHDTFFRQLRAMEPTEFERAVLAWIAERTPSLRDQLSCPDIVRREFTGAGLYVYLCEGSGRVPDGNVDGPIIESPALEHGAGSKLWIDRGVPECLEVFAYGNEFPEHLDDWEFLREDGGG